MRRRGKGKTYSIEEHREELMEFLTELKSECVIVEGIKDKRALKIFGFSDVHVLNKKKGLFEFSSEFKGRVLVLTDFDPEGERIAKKLTELLLKVGCKVEREERNKLRRLFLKNKINTVESLRKIFTQKYKSI
ncbi:MAG TPA: hypothetical protein ENF95_01480 [Candidatus Aenigmarchaeota archaeon]|nr:hypothetical protein [Candidatus Aenigmarchaeota archaeon]